jgi:RimJ/RimL family protein N-acetyltransferase
MNMIKLRTFNTTDCDLLVSYLNDNTVTQYITAAIPQPYSNDDAQWWVNVGSKSAYIKAIELDGTLIGCISADFVQFEYIRSAELGYWLGTAYWNRGLATQAVKIFTQSLFNNTDVVRLFVSVVSDNKPSIRVLEKNGFSHEALLKKASFKKGLFFDECLLSKLKSPV